MPVSALYQKVKVISIVSAIEITLSLFPAVGAESTPLSVTLRHANRAQLGVDPRYLIENREFFGTIP